VADSKPTEFPPGPGIISRRRFPKPSDAARFLNSVSDQRLGVHIIHVTGDVQIFADHAAACRAEYERDGTSSAQGNVGDAGVLQRWRSPAALGN